MKRAKRIDARRSLIKQLQEQGIELDQRMQRALEMHACHPTHPMADDDVFIYLSKLNSIISRQLDLSKLKPYGEAGEERPRLQPEQLRISGNEASHAVFDRALQLVGNGRTFGVYHFVRAAVEQSLAHAAEDCFGTYTLAALKESFGHDAYQALPSSSRVHKFLESLKKSVDGSEDFQFVLALEGSRIVFRVTSVLDDYVQLSETGLFTVQRALLTHFRDQFGGFTQDEIEELSSLLNNPLARETEFQRFFEDHPHFFRRWDCRQVHPHVYLSRSRNPLVPDFILTDRTLQRAVVLDLKLPRPKIVRRQANRDRFASALMEARTQLLRYRDWFRERRNRESMRRLVGMDIYEPRLAVIIGLSSEFEDELDRQRLAADVPDIEVVTYDDILNFAERRRMLIKWDDPSDMQPDARDITSS